MVGTGAAHWTLPITADELTIPHGKDFVGSSGDRGERVIPQSERSTLDDLVRMAAKADGASGIDPSRCARLKVRPLGGIG